MKFTACVLAMLCTYFSIAQQNKIRGRVLNDIDEPIAGASVILRNSSNASITNRDGSFLIQTNNIISNSDSLIVSSIGYITQLLPASRFMDPSSSSTIILAKRITELDEAVVIAYGTTTKRLNVGNITKVSGADIEKQPVSNPLATLAGRVPGLVVTQTSGVPGAHISIQIRGRSSLDLDISRNDPLFIIDGVPFETGNLPVGQLTSATLRPFRTNLDPPEGISPFNSINPHDIESIEILKDADATAIYGSRGANGVILITTKKAKPGKTKLTVNYQTGMSRPGRLLEMMTTAEYVQMRKEAFANDGIVMNTTNAPDILLWDTSHFNDFSRQLIANNSQTTQIQTTVSGGNNHTQFQIGGGYRKESTTFPGTFANTRGSFQMNVFHTPASKKWDVRVSAIYSSDRNRLLSVDLARFLLLPPMLKLYNDDGSLKTQDGGVNYSSLSLVNPLLELEKRYTALNKNLSSNLQFNYHIIRGFTFRTSIGYNTYNNEEFSLTPRKYFPPEISTLASSTQATSIRSSWIVEPQFVYDLKRDKLQMQFLAGTTFQHQDFQSFYAVGEGYTNDLLLQSLDAAATVNASNSKNEYRYNAFFGRINFNWRGKYLINLSGRRDGSSRFGPGKQFANFGAVGMGWVFTVEPWMQSQRILSFGKIRTSFGVTGNDQVGDYRYLDLWNSTSNPYQGIPGLTPATLFNPDYNWEQNRKIEAAIELGFFNDRFMLNVAWYRHRCSNQLVEYVLPSQTGFSSITKNLPALVENRGWEIDFQTTNIRKKDLLWKSNFNISFPVNKLIDFPGLAASPYAGVYSEGYSLSMLKKYTYLGIDPLTGVYMFQDVNGDGNISGADQKIIGDADPDFYGGFGNSIGWKQFQLDAFFEFRDQIGKNILADAASRPGTLRNQPAIFLDRWQKPGDVATFQKYSTATSTTIATARAAQFMSSSDAAFTNGSYIRFKTLSLSYTLSETVSGKLKIQSAQLYLQAQNLATITNFNGNDPENMVFYQTPPLRTISVGIKLIL